MPTSNVEVAHLLRRAGFGGTAAEVAALTPLTRAQLIDRVMDTAANPAVVEPAELALGARGVAEDGRPAAVVVRPHDHHPDAAESSA